MINYGIFRGKLGEGRSSPSAKVLMETKVLLKTDEECTTMTESIFTFNADSMICAHEVKTDACQGDSGGVSAFK
jgi:secreted trypsin-like serine protease